MSQLTYLCLRCREVVAFVASADDVTCARCGARFPLVLGSIPVFLDEGMKEANFYGEMFREAATRYEERFRVEAEHGRWVLLRLLELEPRMRDAFGKRVLEIGAGTGHLTRSLAAGEIFPFRTLVVSDVSPEMLAVNWGQRTETEKGRDVQMAAFNVLKTPFPDGGVDVVLGFDVLHHVLDYRKGLREIHRILAPGGVLVVKEPYREAYRLFAFLAMTLLRDRLALTFRDRRKVTAWIRHFSRLIRSGEEEDHAALATVDDKYFFTREGVVRDGKEAGFGEVSECNVLERPRESVFEGGNFFGAMVVDFFRGVGLSRWGLRSAAALARDVDVCIGDRFLKDYPVNTLFVFRKADRSDV